MALTHGGCWASGEEEDTFGSAARSWSPAQSSSRCLGVAITVDEWLQRTLACVPELTRDQENALSVLLSTSPRRQPGRTQPARCDLWEEPAPPRAG